jgi:hypothetical protein
MNSVILTLALGYVLQRAAEVGASENWAQDTTDFKTWLQTKAPYVAGHPQTAAAIEAVADPAIEALGKALQDTPDLKAAILALAANNDAAAMAALTSLATQSAPQLAAIAQAFGAAAA